MKLFINNKDWSNGKDGKYNLNKKTAKAKIVGQLGVKTLIIQLRKDVQEMR